MRIITIVGARPQIIKAAAFSRAVKIIFQKLKKSLFIRVNIMTNNMSHVFLMSWTFLQPQINLKVGSSSHGDQTAMMIQKIEKVLLEKKPKCGNCVWGHKFYFATAIAASKIHIPIVHIESGLRSFNKIMPEEINRIACDHVSTLLIFSNQKWL